MKLSLMCTTKEKCTSIEKSVFAGMDEVVSKLQSIRSVDSTRDITLMKSVSRPRYGTIKDINGNVISMSTAVFNQSISIIYDFLTEGTDPAIFNVPREYIIFKIMGDGAWSNIPTAIVSARSRHNQRSIEVLCVDGGIPYRYVTNIEDLGLLKYQLLNTTLLSTAVDNSGKCGKVELISGAETPYSSAIDVLTDYDKGDESSDKTVYSHDISHMCPGARKYLDDIAKMATVLLIAKGLSWNRQSGLNAILQISVQLASNCMGSHDEMMNMLREHWEVTPGFFKYHGLEVELPKVRAK